ncbi:MAG TPA: hypothetical protein VI916_11250 [Acidimicrobiia bacterium]|nr:hypothetical protein [Acidimicrobiia bacterium]
MPVPARSPSPSSRSTALSRELVDALFDFALTTTWDPEAADAAVREALSRIDPGSVQAPDLFARVRTAAITRAESPEDAVIDVNAALPAPADLPVAMIESIALSVLDGVEPADRAVLDLAVRRRLEGDDLASALDVAEPFVAGVVRDASTAADHLLGHYVLARIGHDTCPRLREALGDPPPDRLAPLAERVDAHLEECSLCTDRRLGLSAVTSMLDAIPARPAPEALHDAVGHLWEKEDVEAQEASRRRRRWMALVAVMILVVLAGSLIAVQFVGEDSESTIDATATTVLPVLTAETRTVDLGTDRNEGTASIRNAADRAVDYRVEVDVPWLTVTPTSGRVGVGEQAELAFRLDRITAPEGAIVTTVRVRGGGATTEIDITAEIPRGPQILGVVLDPPDLVPDGCTTAEGKVSTTTINATVAATSELASVVAKTSLGDVPLSLVDGLWTATLGPFPEGSVTLTVAATDALGKTAISPELNVSVGTCPAPPTTTRRRR